VTSLLPYLVTGVVVGSLYGLVGVGLVLTYRSSGVFNFGHGAVAAAAAFLFYTLHFRHGLAWPIAALLTVLVFGVAVGWMFERLTRLLVGAADAIVVVATVGVLLVIEGILYLQYGTATLDFPPVLPTSGFRLSGVLVTWGDVVSMAVAVVGTAGLYFFLRTARLGVAMRAVVDNPPLVRLSGDSVDKVRFAAWAFGSSSAAIAGILLAPILNLDVNLLTFLVLQAFGACAIGLFSNLPLTFLGGLVVGVSASLATKYAQHPPFNGLSASMPFLVLFVVLLIVPVSKLPRSRSLSFAPPARRTSRPVILVPATILGIAGLVLVPFIVHARLPVWTGALSLAVIFGSLALLTWGSGQLSLCHAAFVAVGATTMSHLVRGGVPWLPALLIAGLCTMPVGAIVAVPAIRLPGIYLALATLGFGVLMQGVVYGSFLMFGSRLDATARPPRFGPFDAADGRTMYFLSLVIATLCLAAILLLVRGRFGRILRAMAQSPTMLATHGLEVRSTRLIIFCASAFFAGIGGALALTQTGVASAVTYGPVQSLLYVAVLAVCGTRMLRSPILAAALIGVLPEYMHVPQERQLLYFGVVAIFSAVALARRREITTWFASAAENSRFRGETGPAKRTIPAVNSP
jgi:branched-subunit amino acid ABC-type transport system permease component